MRFLVFGINIFLICVGLFFIYGFYIEPNKLRISNITIKFNDLNEKLKGLTILHLSDLHLVKIGRKENKLIEIIDNINPDILVITGDFVNTKRAVDDCIKLISKFKVKYAKFGVLGNYDHSLDFTDREKFKKADINILRNENQKITINSQDLWIVGVDDLSSGYADLYKAVNNVPKEEFKILLSHSPAIFNKANKYNINLVLAGHTHGGQVYIPIISHFIVHLIGAGRYISGLYFKDGLYLYVNRGIGVSLLPLRLFSPPEVAVIRLE